MIAAQQMSDKMPKSWGKMHASYPPTPPPETNESLEWSIETSPSQALGVNSTERIPIVAVIGVGYVGAHLVEAFARHYQVVAYDLNEKRLEVVAKRLQRLPITFTSCATDIRQASHVLIAVPTVLNQDKTIDTTYLRSAIATVEEHIEPGSTVVIESSVAVGMTRQFMGPLMISKSLKAGMSPERVDPGRVLPVFEDIPKVISGLDAVSLQSISQLYGRVFATLLPVSSPEVAEMTKLYENCQRMVCAAYANEMADACDVIGIDAWEVSQAASSKPFGYLPFRPGPGIGGHCIPINPYYLLSNCQMPLLEHATTMSWQRPASVATRFVQSLLHERTLQGEPSVDPGQLRLLVVGLGFKRGQSVMSNSPGAAIICTMKSEYGCHVEFADPLVSAEQYNAVTKMDTDSDWNAAHLGTYDGIIVSVNQEGLDMDILTQLQGVKVQDFSGTLRNSFRNTPLLSTLKSY